MISFGSDDDGAPRAVDPLLPASAVTGDASRGLTCQRCGFPVASRPWGCKNPCANCGTVYPLGDCSD